MVLEPLIITVTARVGGIYEATATFLGVPFSVTGRTDVSGKLLRLLLEAGMPDQRWELRGPDGRLRMTGGSTLARAGAAFADSVPPGQTLSPLMVQAVAAFKHTRRGTQVARQAAFRAKAKESTVAAEKPAGDVHRAPNGGAP